MTQTRWNMPWTLGTIAVLALLGALVFGSYHTTVGVGANLRAAGINPQSLHPYRPPAHRPG